MVRIASAIRKSLLLFCLSLFSLGWMSGQSVGEIQWSSFPDQRYEDYPWKERIKFGYLTIPADYRQPEGKTYRLAFVKLSARRRPALADPILIFEGGWGKPSLQSLDFYANTFLNEDRDLILLDHRGSGYSSPSMCPELGQQVFNALMEDLPYDKLNQVLKRKYDACLDQIEAAGINPFTFGSDTRSQDMILLAEKLDYPAYNLLGVSYGTRTILDFMARSRVKIRSAILDSNCPIGWPNNGRMLQDFGRSLDLLYAACKADPACQKRYPDLRARYLAFLQELETKPLKVKLGDGKFGYLSAEEVNAIVHQLLYESSFYGDIPWLMKQMMKRRGFILKRILQGLEPAVMDNFNALGLMTNVYDHKSLQDSTAQLYQAAIASYSGLRIFDGYFPYYLQDSRFTSYADDKPFMTDVPSLILAGEFDPITPPEASAFLRPYFTEHYYFEFPRVGHGVVNHYCGRQIIQKFLQELKDPSGEGCLERFDEDQIRFRKNIRK
ncbi:MAG: alpha/beta fold hydrolase [Bacteroidota bacterium]